MSAVLLLPLVSPNYGDRDQRSSTGVIHKVPSRPAAILSDKAGCRAPGAL